MLEMLTAHPMLPNPRNTDVTLASSTPSLEPQRPIPSAGTLVGAAQLAEAIAAGELSSTEVVETAIRNICQRDDTVRATTVQLWDQARRQARLADDVAVRARRRGEQLAPLHGVPISLKECFFANGTDATMGCDRFRGRPVNEDGPLLRRLRFAGGILVAKTNVQQAMMLHDSTNPIYGRTSHPCAADRSPGGSSGGEAALLAYGGSALGLGTDLGGSIRQPAHACGIAGLKPTQGRLSIEGCRSNLHAPGILNLVPGPMAPRVDDLTLAMRVLTDDTHVARCDDEVPIPWRAPQPASLEGMRVGYWQDDGYFAASPAIRRSVEEAADALRRRGASVESFTPPNIARVMQLYLGILTADGMRFTANMVSGGRCDPYVRQQIRLSKLPASVRWLLSSALKMFGQREFGRVIDWCGERSTSSASQLVRAALQYRAEFLAAIDDAQFDVLLMPPHGLPAMKHDQAFDLVSAASYCFLPNLLDLPAGVVPVSQVQAEEETSRPASRDRVQRVAREAELGSAGLPVGVQVVGRRWREDDVLAAMKAIEDGVGFTARMPT